MAEKFEVGEIAILHHPAWNLARKVSGPKYPEGTDVLISGPLLLQPVAFPEGIRDEWSHNIRTPDGVLYRVPLEMLRKKRPPSREREEIGEWELCPWRPSVSTVTEKP